MLCSSGYLPILSLSCNFFSIPSSTCSPGRPCLKRGWSVCIMWSLPLGLPSSLDLPTSLSLTHICWVIPLYTVWDNKTPSTMAKHSGKPSQMRWHTHCCLLQLVSWELHLLSSPPVNTRHYSLWDLQSLLELSWLQSSKLVSWFSKFTPHHPLNANRNLSSHWTIFTTLGLVVCPITLIFYLLGYDLAARHANMPAEFTSLVGMPQQMLTSVAFWLTILLIPSICLARDFVWK